MYRVETRVITSLLVRDRREDCGVSEVRVLEILRRLRAAATGRRTAPEPVELDALATISLLGEAATNVNCMLLQQFVDELGFRRRDEFAYAVRIMTTQGALVVLTLEYEDGRQRSQLVYAEFGRVRLSAVFVSDDVAFIRGAHVVVCPFAAVNERVLTGTSLHVLWPYRAHSGPDRSALPPVA